MTMKTTILMMIIGMSLCSCGSGTPGHKEEGKPLYITDSLASQLNTPLPDSNTKAHKDSLEEQK